MPLIALEPPSRRPRGTGSLRPLVLASGSEAVEPVGGRIGQQPGVADRDARPGMAGGAGLQQQDLVARVGRQPVRHHRAGRSGADDDVVVALHVACRHPFLPPQVYGQEMRPEGAGFASRMLHRNARHPVLNWQVRCPHSCDETQHPRNRPDDHCPARQPRHPAALAPGVPRPRTSPRRAPGSRRWRSSWAVHRMPSARRSMPAACRRNGWRRRATTPSGRSFISMAADMPSVRSTRIAGSPMTSPPPVARASW